MSQEKTSPIRQVMTYDSGYEHSVEHWLEMRQMVAAEVEKDQTATPARAFAAAAS